MTPDDAFATIEVAVFRSRASSAVAVVVIQGDTRLAEWAAACWAYRRRGDYPRDMYAIDLDDYRQPRGVDLRAVFRVLLRRTGVWWWRVPKTFPDRVVAYRRRMSQRNVLLVLQNPGQAAQVRPFIAGQAGSVVIVTSRHRLRGLRTEHAEFITVNESGIEPVPGGTNA